MRFAAGVDAYDRSVGRYSQQVAPRFAAFAGVDALARGRVLDVGCGPGALAAWLAERRGGAALSAVDPTEHFVEACRERIPGADVRLAPAEALPFPDATFEAALAQLVFSFVADGPRAAAEMARVVRPGGVVATCNFEAESFGPARAFWAAARRFDPAAPDDVHLPYRREPELLGLLQGAGLREVRAGSFDIEVDYDRFDELWEMFAGGVGPTGGYLLAQPPERREALRQALHESLGRPRAGFALTARVIAVAGRRPEAQGSA
ncbi:MAG: class I SAM-dependent methyltransferase [Anaeromyxobacter sp.]